MGQKVSPIGFRTGVTIGWKSRWFAPKSDFGEFLVEDARIRAYIEKRLNRQPPHAAVSSVEIERTREELKVILRTARPGLVIGPRGAEVDRLKESLEELTNRRVNISIVEVKKPDLDAQLVADSIAEQLKRRSSFRRTMKQRTEAAMQAGAKGVKIIISGRLGGAEMCRKETQILGSIPLHTLEADVDYGFATSYTTYGTIGVKVWIHRGMFGEKSEQKEQEDRVASMAMTRARRRRERGGGRRKGQVRPGEPAAQETAGATPDEQAPPPEAQASGQVVADGQQAPPAAEGPADGQGSPPAQEDSPARTEQQNRQEG